jgi:hypothetical protein
MAKMATEVLTVEEYQARTEGKVTSKRNYPEHDEQVKLFKWAELMSNKYEELNLLFAIPNGAFFFNNWKVINKMKEEGLKSGVPDVFLPVSNKVNGGLWIEMKVGSNKPSDAQKEWLSNLQEQGYQCNVCYSAEEAIEVICEYLDIDEK